MLCMCVYKGTILLVIIIIFAYGTFFALTMNAFSVAFTTYDSTPPFLYYLISC